MTNSAYTDVSFVLDRSGSMESIKEATIGAFNRFVKSQQQGVGTVRLSLMQFDNEFETVYTASEIANVPLLDEQTFQPRGSTALLDAMGRTILATGQRLASLPEGERPGVVLFVTLTDGEENSSHEFRMARINDLISEHRTKYAWQFIFLGANQDAIATATDLGISTDAALTFDANEEGAAATFEAIDREVHKMRSAAMYEIAAPEICFSPKDRAAAKK